MIYHVRHTTTYKYSQSVLLSWNQACLQPRSFFGQTVGDFQLEVEPEPLTRRPWTDYFGNRIWYLAFDQLHTRLSITARSRVERTVEPPLQLSGPSWEETLNQLRNPADLETRAACQFRYDSLFVPMLPETLEYARVSFTPHRPLLDAVRDLTSRIYRDFRYQPAITHWNTPIADVFRNRRGVCQDFSQLALSCLRGVGLAARYVSGYLLTDPPPGEPKQVGSDASHAWFSVYCPGVGWCDFDPTNNCQPGNRHVTTAWGRDYGDVSPVRGVLVGGGPHLMKVAVDVTPEPPAAPAHAASGMPGAPLE